MTRIVLPGMMLIGTLAALGAWADDEAAPPTLRVVSTWGELAGQAKIDVGRDRTIRVGVESDRIHTNGGLLVYALLDGSDWDPQPTDALGPLRIKVTAEQPRRMRQQLDMFQMQMQKPDGPWRNARRLLFVGSVADVGGPALVEVLDGNRVIAKVRLVVDAEVVHPWFTFAGTEDNRFDGRFNNGESSGESFEVTLSPDLSQTGVPHYDGVEPAAWDTADKPIADDQPLPRFVIEPEQATVELTATRRRKDYRLDIKLPEAVMIGDVRSSVLVRWWIDGQPVRPPADADVNRMFDQMNQVRRTNEVRINLSVPEQTFGRFGGERVELQLLWCPDGWDSSTDQQNRFQQIRRIEMRMRREGPAATRQPIMSNRVEIVMPYRVGFNYQHEHHPEFALAAAAEVAADPRDGVE